LGGLKVGILGLGGLGQMGLKLAKALGNEVSVISSSESKRQVSLDLGATHFVLSSDSKEMNLKSNYFDLILDFIPREHDVSP